MLIMESSPFLLRVVQKSMTHEATAVVKHSPQVIKEALFLHLFICVQLAWRRRLEAVRIIQVPVVFGSIGHSTVSFPIGAK